jgi:hypothetical protein
MLNIKLYTIAVILIILNCCNVNSKENKFQKESVKNFDTIQYSTKVDSNYLHFEEGPYLDVEELVQLKKFALSFVPKSIDISTDIKDSISFYCINKLYKPQTIDSLLEISKILLLKLYLHHLQRANQGYDLYTMRRGEARKIIDLYLIKNNIDTIGEFLNSGIVWEIEKNKINNSQVNKIISEIENEKKRIMLMD